MIRERTLLTLGRGEVYFERFASAGVRIPGEGERYIGNTPSFRIERDVERMERFTSYRGQKHEVKGAVISESVKVSMTTDHMDPENIALWYSRPIEYLTDGSTFTPYTETLRVKKDRFYQLGTSRSDGGFEQVSNLTARLEDATGVLLVQDTDYFLEASSGRIYIPKTAFFADDTAIFLTYNKSLTTKNVTKGESSEVYGALRYIATNPYGPLVDYYFPQVRIYPRGAVDLKSDEFHQFSFDLVAVRLGPSQPLVYSVMRKSSLVVITADNTVIRADTTVYRADNGTS